MKKASSLTLLLLSALLFHCCKPEGVTPVKGTLTFSVTKTSGSGGRKEEITSPAFILLSIEDENGKAIETNKKITLLSFGQGYISENIPFSPGNFELTEFLVLDSDNKIIYATPLEGAERAHYVTDPLPIAFEITENATTQLRPQVIAVQKEDNPEIFGYSTFGFEVISPCSLVKEVRITEAGQFGSRYRMAYTYENNRLTETNEFYCYPDFTTCTSVAKITYGYDDHGRLSTHTYESNGEIKTRQFIYQQERLVIIRNDQGYNWDKVTTFTYTAGNPVPSGAVVTQGSQSKPWYIIDYHFNAEGNQLSIIYFTTSSEGTKKIHHSSTYTLDHHLKTGPQEYMLLIDEYPLEVKNNIIGLESIWYDYNATPGEQCTMEWKYDFNEQGLIQKETALNPNGCFLGDTGVTVKMYEYLFN